jgi:hypothetical protein
MSIIGTFNGMNIVALPSDTFPRVVGPSSIEWDEQEVVASDTCTFTGQMLTYDWMASWFEGQVSFPPMTRYSHDAWSAFISECRGPLNCFLLGDPKAKLPKGCASGTPVVNGGGQSGYSLSTRGWTPNTVSVLLFGDYIQIGYRLYKVVDAVNSDSEGNATLSIWPPLRDLPTDGETIQTRNCKGLFKLKNTSNKRSTNAGSYGITALDIREAF